MQGPIEFTSTDDFLAECGEVLSVTCASFDSRNSVVYLSGLGDSVNNAINLVMENGLTVSSVISAQGVASSTLIAGKIKRKYFQAKSNLIFILSN